MREVGSHPIIRPAAVVLACAALVCLTAGLGLLVTFHGLAPWNGVALCLIATAVLLGGGEGMYLRRRPGGRSLH